MNNALYFYDPNHGGCLRVMYKMNDQDYIIHGAYGSDEEKRVLVCKCQKSKRL